MKYASALTAAALAALPCAVLPQSAAADLNLSAQDPCRAEVSKFEQALAFIRQSQGNQAGQDLKEKLLPAKLETEILFKDGYCGLAKYLRDRKLNR